MRDRLESSGGGMPLRKTGLAPSEIVQRLEAGESPDQVVASTGLDPLDLIRAVGVVALGSEGSEGPPLEQTKPSRPKLAAALSESALAKLLPHASRRDRFVLSAGMLQIHDFWDASHTAAQEADDLGEKAFSAYWHGVAHRREPDPGNASYWFRRVGKHPTFGPLAQAVKPTLDEHGDPSLTARLGRGMWDPFAFIDVCSNAQPGSSIEKLARRLQRLEMALLLEATAEAVLKA